ncbi:MAG TPA: 16S rRNA (cytosine(967)-C(5))-methyltransferase RsmB [Candidatus Hydrogenedentes bacterium]|nr:16S rRNA (cytosine(967)-C(5))-methyltransferase RsmB [Candidatus Hydrogenedentota bacterium]
MPVDLVRDCAVSALMRILENSAHTDVVLDRILRKRKLSSRGSRFLTHLVYGVVRHKLLCDHVLSDLCDQPLDKIPAPVLMVLRMGVFQAFFCANVTRPALVHTSVDLARRRGNVGLAKLANAVLRRLPDRLEAVRLPDREHDFINYLRVRYSMPRWMVRLWMDLFGADDAEKFCAVCNTPAPVTIRVNTLRTDRETLARQLVAAGYAASPVCDCLDALSVTGEGNLFKSKLFLDGLFMLQDPASMLAAAMTTPRPGQRILDMCAAPGGKATHMAALSGGKAFVVAAERYLGRMERIRENCARMGMSNLSAVCADGLQAPFEDGAFDCVLLDAPCSGLGTLRRHPEIKWRAMPDMPARMAVTQRALLRKAMQLCKNGGLIVYSVCTLTRQETLEVVEEVMSDGTCVSEDAPEQFNSWKTAQGQYQTNPLGAAWDGFFLTRFRKRS